MFRLLLPAVSIALAPLAWAVDLPADQNALRQSYARLEAAVARLADTLSETDPARAQQLREVVRSTRASRLSDRFDEVVRELERQQLAAAARGQATLADELQAMLAQLTADPRAALLKQRAEWAEQLARQVESLEREQRALRGAAGQEPNGQQAAEQQRLAAEATRLAASAAEDPLGEASEAGQSAAEPLGVAGQQMRAAAERIAQADGRGATQQQSDAIEALKEARRRLEETLRQIREEEQQQRLASLGERFQEMLRRQEPINQESTRLRDEQPARSRSVRREFDDLAERERGVAQMAAEARRLIEAEDSSVAFAFAVAEVERLLGRAAERLTLLSADSELIGLQSEATGLLKDLSDAVEQELAERQSNASQQEAGDSPAADARLTSMIAELKMLRRLQAGMLKRSRNARPTEAPELARRQRRIAEATQALLKRAE